MRQLIGLDHAGATVADDEGHTLLMIAADRAYETHSEVTQLVMNILERAQNSGRPSGAILGTGALFPGWQTLPGTAARPVHSFSILHFSLWTLRVYSLGVEPSLAHQTSLL